MNDLINILKKIFNFLTGIGKITDELKVQSSKENSSLFINGLIFFALFVVIPFLIAYQIAGLLNLLVILIIGLITLFFIHRALISISIIRQDLEEKTNKLIYERLKKLREFFEKKYGFYVNEVNTEFWIFGIRNIFNSIYVIFLTSILNILPLAYLIQNYNSLFILSNDWGQTFTQIIFVYILALSIVNIFSIMLIYGQRNEKFNYYKITYTNKKTIIGKIIKRNEEEITLSKSGETIKIKTSDILKEKLIA